ncbi:MAG TPA: hypothetical protein VLT61_07890 [Anaeromyxobacteraceae bacterium]|nr:hypothetical protein [Anaeromyxobacteraceae bacterium]
MEQLVFFTEPAAIEYAEFEGLIDPKLDAAFLSEIAEAFAKLEEPLLGALGADAA